MIYFKNPLFIENKINKKIKNIKKKNFFCLPMFPYPSGKLHLGHVRNYVLSDIISKIKYLEKNNILHPIAWDSFGLPAENASKINNLNPIKWTISNIKLMRSQLKKISIFYNKNCEFLTCDINFYKWEFWILINFLKNNLLKKKYDIIYWDNIEKSILSNEQIANNICWRSGSKPIKKKISTWFIDIKKYTKRLLINFKYIKWSNKIKKIQKKWINIKLFFYRKFNLLYLNYNIFFINIINIKKINNNLLYLIIKNNLYKIIIKKKIYIYDKINKINKKIIFTNFNIKKLKIKKKKLNFIIFKKKIFLIKKSNIKNWAFERQRLWGSFLFFKKVKNKNFKSKTTIDTFFQSSWYYLNYLKTKNINNKKKDNWLPINIYIGGEEHANLHLLYIRIINNIFYDFNILNNKEVISNLINQGFINNKVYYKIINFKKVFCKKSNKSFFSGIEKMSKSKKNGINPVKIIHKNGSDILRLSILVNKPIEKTINWENINFNYIKKFILKINNLIIKNNKNLKKVIDLKLFLNIKKIHNLISNINKILIKNNSNNQLKNIIYWLFPIIPNISKIFWFKIGNNFPIESYCFFKKKINCYKIYNNNFFIKNIKKLTINNFIKTFLLIKLIRISMDEISILLN